jgi:hypothetical protein
VSGTIHDWLERRAWERSRQRDPIRHLEPAGASGSSLLRRPFVIPIGRHDYRWSLSGIGFAGSGSVLLSRKLPVLRHSMGIGRCVGGCLMRLAVVDPGLLSHEEERECRVAAI